MRKLFPIAVAVVVCIVFAWAQAPMRHVDDKPVSDAPAASPPSQIEVVNLARPFRFVGVTSQTFDGGVGWLAMTRACESEFPNSRMAFSDEIYSTLSPPDIVASAWLTLAVIDGDGAPDGPVAWDRHGHSLPVVAYRVNCESWNSNSASSVGLVLTTKGSVVWANCSQSFAVACAAAK